jgi:predicted nucleic acid-binding protein
VKRFVLDASVALSWFVDRPASPYAEHVKKELLHGTRAVVPVLWHVEMANGLIVAERRRTLAGADVEACLTSLEALLTDSIETSAVFSTVRQSNSLARTFKLSAYDALYLDLARAENLPLATLDQALRKAAPEASVKLLD